MKPPPIGIEVIIIDPGNSVICDICNKDCTDEQRDSGFLFQSKGVCPDCAPRLKASIEKYGEQEFIRGYCPDGVGFADWIRSIR